jgi:hypothetical protein
VRVAGYYHIESGAVPLGQDYIRVIVGSRNRYALHRLNLDTLTG